MYRLGKSTISQYIRTNCQRRLRLDLYKGIAARRQADAPGKNSKRPGLQLLTKQGKQYERAKFRELEAIFANLVVRGEWEEGQDEEDRVFQSISLIDHIDRLRPNQLALEVQFGITASFKSAHALNDLAEPFFKFDEVRPDILQVQASTGQERRIITPAGRLERIGPEDRRLGLRIIDIKIAGQPSPAHFSELAYYGMVLSGWLQDKERAGNFVVLADAAIWPGAHAGSTIHRMQQEDRADNVPTLDLHRYLGGLEEDLKVMPPEVVLGRVQRFLAVDLREVLSEPDWRRLPWHIGHRCAGCDYLGYEWSHHTADVRRGAAPDARYCWPTAVQTEHLSRIAGLTEGACGRLREANVDSVSAVSDLAVTSRAFESHQVLLAKRTVLRARAAALRDQAVAEVADRAGTSAVLPKFADICVSVSADFDVGSGLTFAFGYRLTAGVPVAARPDDDRGRRFGWNFRTIERPMLVLAQSLETEGETLRTWLEHLVTDIRHLQGEALAGYRNHVWADKKDVTIQFYLWDRLTYEHLCRVFGRHLDRLQAPVVAGGVDLNPMAWIFPSEGVLQEPGFVSRSSPITVVSDAISSLVAAPVPHHYGIIDLAHSIEPETRRYPDGRPWDFKVNEFYRDPLSDQIPSERGHEVWEQASPFRDQDFQWHQEQVRRVVKRKLHAIAYVAEKLTRWLAPSLASEAPGVGSVFAPTARLDGVSDDGQIWFQHTRLMVAAQQIEVDLLMAMPPHEREARFRSARVEAVLVGGARDEALRVLGLAGRTADPAVLVFRLSRRSKEARLKKEEYAWSFLPEADLPALQELTVAQFKERHPDLEEEKPIEGWDRQTKLRGKLGVTILGIDRGQQLLAVKAGDLLHAALQLGLLQMELDGSQGRFGILDPVAMDYFTRKLKRTFADESGLRNPPLARQRPLFPTLRVARVRSGRPRQKPVNEPAAHFLWNADGMAAAPTGEDATAIIATATRMMPGLTPQQRRAIEQAAARRLSLWWGPPGTGKSRTAQAYLTALAAEAVRAGRSLRLAVVGFTWTAIDHVARRLPKMLADEGIADRVRLARLSSGEGPSEGVSELRDHVIMMKDAESPPRLELERRLTGEQGVTIVASTVDQLYKLEEARACAPLFDVMLIDEASQLDVAHACVGLSKLSGNGRVVVVGDDKQMAPIHPLEAPQGLDHLLGSIYDFFRRYRAHENHDSAVEPIMLDRSFRSNREIVEFVREAGYGEALQAADSKAGLRLATMTALAGARPADWPEPERLLWSPHLAAILSPDEPLAAVVHNDHFSSQRNDEEANLVAALVLTLYRAGVRDLEETDGRPYSPAGFFRRGVGIVTPHRAQQAAIFDRLDEVLPPEVNRNEVFASIDTVERFQGQERAVVLVSFGLGDADQIAVEEQFLFSLNRFNVAASRAQVKFIALVSRRLVDHLPRDPRVLAESRLLKHFIDGFLTRTLRIELPRLGPCDLKLR